MSLRPARPLRFTPHVAELEDRTTPAMFYVQPSLSPGTADEATGVTFNAGKAGTVTGLRYSTDENSPAPTTTDLIFPTLEAALLRAAANAGTDTIQLASETITIDNSGGTVNIQDTVTIVGNGTVAGSKSVLVPAADTADELTDVVLIDNGVTVNITNVTFDGTGFDLGSAFHYDGDGTKGTLTGVTIQNVRFTGQNTSIGLYVSTSNFTTAATAANVVFTNGTITGYGLAGVQFEVANGTVAGTTITGGGAGVGTQYGVAVFDLSAVAITGSTITANGGTGSAGVYVDGSTTPAVSAPGVSLIGNTISGNATGVLVGDAAGDPSSATAVYNNITGNTVGVNTTNAANTLDFRANFWGNAGGPGVGGANPVSGSKATVSPFVTRGTVPVRTSSSVDDYRAAVSQQTFSTVPDIAVNFSTANQTLTLTANVSGTNVVGTLTFTVRVRGGATIGTPVTVPVVNGVATGQYVLPGGTLPGDYDIAVSYDPGVELLFANTGATGFLTVNPVSLSAVGAGKGGNAAVIVFDPAGNELFRLSPFGNFSGGARVATADVTGDGIDDIIIGAGPGGASTIVVINGQTRAEIARFLAFEASFTGGVYVAAGDVDGDGFADVVVAPDEGGGPVLAVYKGSSLAAGTTGDAAQLNRYLGIQDTGFRGGARPAVGDINDDGRADIVVSAGFLGGPRITIWDGAAVAAGRTKLTDAPLANFFAFEETLRNGAFVAVGDVNGDGKGDLIFGGGPGGGPRVRVTDGPRTLAAGNFGTLDNKSVAGIELANFFAGSDSNRGGVRIVGDDLDNDGLFEILTASGDGEPTTVRRYTGASVNASIGKGGNPSPASTFDPFRATLLGGIFVG